MNRDFMLAALEEAQKAMLKGEVPVGAVIVKNNRIIAARIDLALNNHSRLQQSAFGCAQLYR